MIAVRVVIEGRVQGVGFRAFVEREARTRQLTGYVRNCRDGSVEAVFAGEDSSVGAMIEACRRGPRLAAVARLTTFPQPAGSWSDFAVWPAV